MNTETKRDIKSKNTKAHILNLAIALLEDKQFEDISIREICKQAKVSTGAFYHHFDSKLDILYETHKKHDSNIHDSFQAIPDTLPIKTQILLAFEIGGEYISSIPIDTIKPLYKHQLIDHNTDIFSKDDLCFSYVNTLVKKGLDNKELSSDKTSEDITDETLVITRGIIYDWTFHNGAYDFPKRLNSIINAYLHSI